MTIDKRRLAQNFSRAASHYRQHAALQQAVCERLLERLDLFRLQPTRILDLGCGTGFAWKGLRRHYPRADIIGLDLAHGMLRESRRGRWWRRERLICADAERLPLVSGAVDLVFSSLMLQWCAPPDRALAESLRVLKPGGLLLASSLGPDTLKELRAAWAASAGSAGSPPQGMGQSLPFVDLHDFGDALIRAGFSAPVVDVEHITLTYPHAPAILRDLHDLGTGDARVERERGLIGPGRMRAFARAYEQWRRPDGTLPATYEVVYAHAFGPRPDTRPQDGSTVAAFPFSALRGRRGIPS
ncbi:MAG TPA: malonyl-[acyl-carrier protein] O-methyltransferase BioC [Gammaproteobacteria bacterium]|nr:malonyl-[acyl-carrier protein] O-methyltransferase BioC [Gammaproteobacteria bacterium]